MTTIIATKPISFERLKKQYLVVFIGKYISNRFFWEQLLKQKKTLEYFRKSIGIQSRLEPGMVFAGAARSTSGCWTTSRRTR